MDSTRSHPPPASDKPVIRVKRTYGRPKDTSGATHQNIAGNPTDVQTTGLSSNTLDCDFDASDDDVFRLKQSMAAIDRIYDDSEVQSNPVNPGDAILYQANAYLSPGKPESEPDSNMRISLISGDLSPLPSSSHIRRASPLPSKSRLGLKKRVLIHSDDSQTIDVAHDDDSSPASSRSLHPINTPKLHSPPTPPTSIGSREASPIGIGMGNCDGSVVLDDDEDTIEYGRKARERRKGKRKEEVKKSKGLTKKELQETKRNQARLTSDQLVSIPRRTETKLMQLPAWLQVVDCPQTTRTNDSKQATSSDPIQQFTSPVQTISLTSSAHSIMTTDTNLAAVESEDEKDMPDVASLLQAEANKRAKKEDEERRKHQLALRKQRFLEQQAKATVTSNSKVADDDDDLELVESDADINGRISCAQLIPGRKLALENKASLIRINPARRKSAKGKSLIDEKECFELAAKPVFGERSTRGIKKNISEKELQKKIYDKAMKQRQERVKQKEEEWIRRGGKLKGRGDDGDTNAVRDATLRTQNFGELDEKTLKARGHEHAAEIDNEDGDQSSDEEWTPSKRGLASPNEEAQEETSEGNVSEGGDDADVEEDTMEDDATRQQQDRENLDCQGSDDEPRKHSRRTGRRPLRVVNSDSEDSDNRDEGSQDPGCILVPDTSLVDYDSFQFHSQAQFLAHRGSISSFEESFWDEDDKENDTRRMYDQSEDKENTAIPRHTPVGRTDDGPGFGVRRNSDTYALAGKTGSQLSIPPHANDLDAGLEQGRKPLDVLDDPFIFSPPEDGVHQKHPLTAFSPLAKAETQSYTGNSLQPAFVEGSCGLSQIFDDDDDDDDAFGPLEEKNDENGRMEMDSPCGTMLVPMKLGGFSQLFSLDEPSAVDTIKRSGDVQELSLTMDVILQPALEVTSQVRRKADAIFEKEQMYVIEEANRRPLSAPELYITENGLLTQTRPDVSTPLIYRQLPPSQNSTIQSPYGSQYPLSTQRQPLGTLSFTSEMPTPSDRQPLSRLVKGRQRGSPIKQNPSDYESNSKHDPSPQPRNAFEIMLDAGRNKTNKKKTLERTKYIEGEAIESDDDEMHGFGRNKVDDDDDDDDDQDAQLEGLVDDTEMDVTTLAADKILEKHMEHQAIDDAENQKLHQAAAEGKFRSKRRGGGISLDTSDSDDDDDDDENKRLRSKGHKKRKVEGDTLEDLDELSRPYYEAYHRDLEDDAKDDFAHLTKDVMDVVDNESGDEDPQPKVISTAEVETKLRQAARSGTHRRATFDPDDVEWAEHPGSLGDNDDRVKDVQITLKKPAVPRRAGLEQLGFGDNLESSHTVVFNDQFPSWANEQNSSRKFVSRSAAAVTGHGQSKAVRSSKPTHYSSSSGDRRRPVKTGSILATLTEKQSRFES